MKIGEIWRDTCYQYKVKILDIKRDIIYFGSLSDIWIDYLNRADFILKFEKYYNYF